MDVDKGLEVQSEVAKPEVKGDYSVVGGGTIGKRDAEDDNDDLSEGEDLRGDLEETLEGEDLKFAGGFHHCALQPTAPNPCLHIAGLGLVGLPLSERDAKTVISVASLAPFGRGERTLVDKEVRDTWEIEPSKISFANPEWDKYIDQTVCVEVCRALGVTIGNIPPKMELYKLLLYEKGSHFLPHQDTQKANGMFATVIILLPSAYTGGQVIVSHSSTTKTIDFSANSLLSTALLAWYTDVKHEVKPVTSGYRFALSYNLIHQSPAGIPRLKDTSDAALRLKRVLEKWREDKYSDWKGNMMAYLLQHQYSSANLKEGIKCLKGTDLHRITFLRPIAEELGFVVGLASLEHNISGQGEDVGCYGGGRWGRRRYGYYDDYSDYDDYEDEVPPMGEVESTSTTISDLVDLDGNILVGIGKMDLDSDRLIPEDPFDDATPDDEEYEGYQGNYGGQVDQWYRRTVLVLVHRNNVDDLCYAAEGPPYAIRKLKESSQTPTSEDRYWAGKVLSTPTQLSREHVLLLMDYALKWKDLGLWKKVMSCPMCTLQHVEVGLLLKAWTLFSFEDVRVSYEQVLARSTVLTNKMAFLTSIRGNVSNQERQAVLAWYKQESGKILTSPALSNLQDSSTILTFLQFAGLEAFKTTTMPNVLKATNNYTVLLALFNIFQEHRNDIIAKETQFRATESSATATTPATDNSTTPQVQPEETTRSIDSDIDSLLKDCLKATASQWSAPDPRQYSYGYLYGTSSTSFKIDRIITILEKAILLSEVDICRNLFVDIIKSNGSSSDKFEKIYNPLIPRLKTLLTQKKIDICTSPYVDFLQLVIGIYLRDILGKKGELNNAKLRNIGCGCGDCNGLDAFILAPSTSTHTFRLAQARRTHLEQRCNNARDLVTHTTIRSGSPHGLQVTKRPEIVQASTWAGRQKAAVAFLKSIGDDVSLRKIMGSRFQDVINAVAGTTPFGADSGGRANTTAAQVLPATNTGVQQRASAQTAASSSQARTSSTSLLGATVTPAMQASSNNSNVAVTPAAPTQASGTKRKNGPAKYIQLGPVIDLSSDDD
ncbi:hypothetical protein D9613_008504 [Agrocybe pediades]|uniref:Prolyl 4-hydroxylase alpha subunit Fe(2+) 2OG dioxygenase domain-containing protein n=1 Tax=Agrocybe pediades TaxID=84607 RepID=A0A8H4QUC2_9AGAR|nr:hypothetical protein D9613_008504 [Agrocybe pediades]